MPASNTLTPPTPSYPLLPPLPHTLIPNTFLNVKPDGRIDISRKYRQKVNTLLFTSLYLSLPFSLSHSALINKWLTFSLRQKMPMLQPNFSRISNETRYRLTRFVYPAFVRSYRVVPLAAAFVGCRTSKVISRSSAGIII